MTQNANSLAHLPMASGFLFYVSKAFPEPSVTKAWTVPRFFSFNTKSNFIMKTILLFLCLAFSSYCFSQGFLGKENTEKGYFFEFNGYRISTSQAKLDADTKELYERTNDRIKVVISYNTDWDCVSCVVNDMGYGEISVFDGNYRTDYKVNRTRLQKDGNKNFIYFYYGRQQVATIETSDGKATYIAINNHDGRYFQVYYF